MYLEYTVPETNGKVYFTIRLAQTQLNDIDGTEADKNKLVRDFKKLVSCHFKKSHKLQFYAAMLNKSPKTLSNLFSKYHNQSPAVIIRERIINEAKNLFLHSSNSDKQIAYELGFVDPAHFSRFFKNYTSQTPSEFRKIYSLMVADPH